MHALILQKKYIMAECPRKRAPLPRDDARLEPVGGWAVASCAHGATVVGGKEQTGGWLTPRGHKQRSAAKIVDDTIRDSVPKNDTQKAS